MSANEYTKGKGEKIVRGKGKRKKKRERKRTDENTDVRRQKVGWKE